MQKRTHRPVLASALALVIAACVDTTPPTAFPSAREVLRPSPNAAASQVVPNEYLVVLKPGVTDVHAAADQARALGGTVLAEWSDALHGYWVHLPSQAMTALAHDPQIDWIEPNGVATASGTEICAAGYVGCSWGLDRIDQASSALDLQYNYPASTGSNVHVYIIDTGIRISHQEFGGRATYGPDYIDNDNIPDDCHGHGTHVAGTVGGAIYGVAKGVQLVAVRVLNCAGSGTWGQIINGINWVTANAIKPAVASMSLGGAASSTVDQAVTNSVSAGITYSIAAGNSNADACNYSPARTPSAITVGATGGSGIPAQPVDNRASYSNYGTCLDIFAPGTNITSAWNSSNSATNTISGTSMATPHVTGVAALYLAQNPTSTPAQVTAALVNNATNGVVSNAGTGSPNKLLYMGFLNGSPPSNLPPVATFSISCIVGQCTLDASNSTDDHGIVSYQWTAPDRPTLSGVIITRYVKTATPNTYSETLTVTDANGLTNSITKTVSIPTTAPNQSPTATITQPANNSVSTAGQTISFQGTGSDPEDGALSGSALVWTSSRDGQIGTGTSFNSTTLSVGTHTITLTSTDSQGATGTAQISITVNAAPPTNQPPVANFSITCDAVARTCTLDAGLSTDDGGLGNLTFTWTAAGRPTVTGQVVTRWWRSGFANTYDETLTVRDAGGLTSSITKTVTIP